MRDKKNNQKINKRLDKQKRVEILFINCCKKTSFEL